MKPLTDFQLAPRVPSTLIQVSGFIEGEFLKSFSQAYQEAAQGNPYLSKLQDGKGSSPLIGGLANKVLAETGFRVATPTDDVYTEIFPLVEGKHYTDFNAFDVWEQKQSYTQNQQLWEDTIALAREQKGSDVNFPFRLQGFYVTPDTSAGGIYQVKLEAAPNTRVIEDERIGLPSGTTFDELDQDGMIVPKENGKFARYTLDNGLSAVYLNNNGNLNSYYNFIDYSDDGGRVVVVDAEGVSAANKTGGSPQ